MAIEEDIYTALMAHAPLTDLIADRAYPNIKSQDSDKPAVVINFTGREYVNSFQGHDQLSKTRVQLDAYANDPDLAAQVGKEAGNALAATDLFETVFDDYSNEFEESTKLYRVLRFYNVWHNE